MEDSKKTVDGRAKQRKKAMPNVRVKVSKQEFDKVLGKLIQSKPIKRSS